MIPSPILKVLSTLSTHGVQYLLMGGQACVLYGGAEFSRDCDIAILCDPSNLSSLQNAIDELGAKCITVPPFEPEYLLRGHAVHFRCHAPGLDEIRLDVMAIMRGVASFPDLWARRTTIELDGTRIEMMSLPDLIAAKKTQRTKDWPMIRRLVEANFQSHEDDRTDDRVRFWLKSALTPELLIRLVQDHPVIVAELVQQRPLLIHAQNANRTALEAALAAEEAAEREADRAYWTPLRAELERLRHAKR